PGQIDAPPSVYALADTMMALNPLRRYQTPSQLIDAIKACRRDVEVGTSPGAQRTRERTLFLVESSTRLQQELRQKFKEMGFRVLMALDPTRAIDRFRQAPFDALVVDAGTVGEEGLHIYERVHAEAKVKGVPCAGVLILSEEQSDWASQVSANPRGRVLVRPVGWKKLKHTLEELLAG